MISSLVTTSQQLYIGCISGTSIDGLDIALVKFEDNKIHTVQSDCIKLPEKLRHALSQLCDSNSDEELERFGRVDHELGKFIGKSTNDFLTRLNINPESVTAIGSHGQTIRHRPEGPTPFSIQIGNGHAIAEHSGIMTINDFRMADMVCGGQGAPLVPAFHEAIFSSKDAHHFIINLGGIGNISVIPEGHMHNSYGYDIGPANTLLDRWIECHKDKDYDENGAWASSGKVIPSLLKCLYSDPFFSAPAPKSTGREYFNLHWLNQHEIQDLKPEDVQRTLLELSAVSVADTIKAEKQNLVGPVKFYVCGGGAHNQLLIDRIETLSNEHIQFTDELGIPVDDVEACAFAWLAKQTTERKAGNLISATGASRPKILGAIH
ncbi:anhydro-N-acetylmuramic acid kinase, partial [Oleiphilus sp. HI0066]|uniref:anhydro-N-acetylmuramic acid kinase n=5 Tax=Oleiphilus TaxID=141450 RepID=UPI0007C3EC17